MCLPGKEKGKFHHKKENEKSPGLNIPGPMKHNQRNDRTTTTTTTNVTNPECLEVNQLAI